LWRDLKNVENKSISSSVKRYSRYTREQMQDFSEKIDLKYLLGILNSKYASVLLSNLRGGDYHIYPEHLRQTRGINYIGRKNSKFQKTKSKIRHHRNRK
jgi:adenine-specific DNA-methyltransferase